MFWNACVPIVDFLWSQLTSSHKMAFVIRISSAPPHPKTALFVPCVKSSLCIVFNPWPIPSTSQLMILVGSPVQATIDFRIHELLLVCPKRSTKFCEMMKENAFKCLTVLATLARMITKFLKNAISAEAVPSVRSRGPTSSPHNAVDQLVAILEVRLIPRGNPESSVGS